ncbi:hypothetical protein AVEN_246857-1 [Araneus ventricosus]|uniref:Uncharacterized protein n=1 Tax=Araneus ventricosus TaxID=182803 RepID=A0A4Y2KXN3_ARAVE|nr:hypothetical protein AVEN_246857-1 [Araneus ventricosus]
MSEHLDSVSMTSWSEQPAPAHLNSVASTPPRTDISYSHTPFDCSVRLQDILASPSPICKRTPKFCDQSCCMYSRYNVLTCGRRPDTERTKSPEQILNTLEVCTGCTPPQHPTEIQQTPEDVIEIIRALSITESPETLFPDVPSMEVPDNSNVDKNECDKEIETVQKSLLDPLDPVGESHPAIRIENVSSPVQMQQVEYFPFSLRCAFCDLLSILIR